MEGARLLFLNSPGNPTGAVESPESICALVESADDHGVTVVSDEVYEHFTYGKPHVSAACYGENVITVNAASKTYAMTGWRIGFLAADESVIGQCMKVHQVPARPAPPPSPSMRPSRPIPATSPRWG